MLALLDRAGIPLGAHRWDAVLLVAGVGVALALRSPLVGILIVPEMTGQLSLIPVTAVVVLIAYLVSRPFDRMRGE